MYNRVLIATDGSPLSERAVDTGINLATSLKASVIIATVGAPYAPPLYAGDLVPNNYLTANEHDEKVRASGQEILDQACAKAKAAGLQYETGFDARRCQLPRPEARLAISSGVSEAPGSSVGRIPIVSPSLPEPETSAPDRAELCATLGFEDAPPRPVSRPVDPSESEPGEVGLWGFSLTVLSFDRF